ncbi:MAG: ParB/RepB/Spo0J family partition protein [Thermoleophilia bacterium]|nr:ParB/RepB/Spo0J family partition protein [Thermoleophilia bacterium]
MAEKRDKRGLGRGLSSLLGDPGPAAVPPEPDQGPAAAGSELPLASIRPNPHQPRTDIDPAALAALADSIRSNGLLQPLVVRSVGDHYELIAGERRWRAAQEAGLTYVAAVVREAGEIDRLRLALIENVVREDLNAVELANACATLIDDFGQTQEEIGRTLGRSRPAVSNLIRLLELPDDVQEMIASGDLSEGHGRAVLGAEGTARRRRVAQEAVERGLSVRATEALARPGAPSRPPRGTREQPPSEVTDAATEAFGTAFDVPVKVRQSARGPVVVELRFDDEFALNRALRRLS